MAKNNLVQVGGELTSVAKDGIVADAAAIMDYTTDRNKTQKEINDVVADAIEDLQEKVSGSGSGTSLSERVSTLESDLSTVKGKIPSSASSLNKLVDSKSLSTETTERKNADIELSDRMDDLETIVGTGGSVNSRINNAVNTLNTEISQDIEDKIQQESEDRDTAISNAVTEVLSIIEEVLLEG